jgi:hypothetical protein
MQEETTTIQDSEPKNATPKAKPVEKQKSKNDYLLPALLFIALFFAFFILITVARLTKGYVYKEDTSSFKATSVKNTIIKAKTQLQPTPQVESLKDTLQKDDATTTDQVTDDVLNSVDIPSEANDEDLDSTGLDDLE